MTTLILNIKEFKKFIKNKINNIENLKLEKINNNLDDWSYNNYHNEELQSISIKLNYNYKNGLLITKDHIVYSLRYILSMKSNKYLKLFKRKNIKLNYNFISYLVEYNLDTKVFKWCIKNKDYLNKYILNEPREVSPYYMPRRFEDFIYNCLRNNNLDRVRQISNMNFNINENNLFERIFIEFNPDSDWDIYFLLDLFVLKKNFNWNIINPIIRIKILFNLFYSHDFNLLKIKENFPNILKNKEIDIFLNGKSSPEEYQITKRKIKTYRIFSYLYNDFEYNIDKKHGIIKEKYLDEIDDDDVYTGNYGNLTYYYPYVDRSNNINDDMYTIYYQLNMMINYYKKIKI